MSLSSVLRLAGSVLAAAVLIWILDHQQGRIVAWLEAGLPRAKTAPLPLGETIARERESRLIQKVTREYGRVKVELDAARAKRLDVSRLEPLLLDSLNLARQKRFDHALTLLNRIEMSIPRPSAKVVPAHESDPAPEEAPLKAAPVRRRSGRRS